MQRPLAQENWLGEQVRAGPGRDRQSFSSWWCLALPGKRCGTNPRGSCEAQAQKPNFARWAAGVSEGPKPRPQSCSTQGAAKAAAHYSSVRSPSVPQGRGRLLT